MSCPLIYLPQRSGQDDAAYLASVGLGALSVDRGPDYKFCDRGPDGGQGVLCYWPQEPAYIADERTISVTHQWQTFDGFWLGRNGSVTPADLARQRLHPGKQVVLSDGQSWQIPVARQLPHLLGLGKPRIKDAYKPFFDSAISSVNEWLQISEEGPGWQIPWQAGFELCCAALAVNYRLAPVMVDWLGLVSTEELVAIVEAVTEGLAIIRTLELLQKKSESDSLTSDTPPIAAGAPA